MRFKRRLKSAIFNYVDVNRKSFYKRFFKNVYYKSKKDKGDINYEFEYT